MKFLVMMINEIHMECNDIHWEGCLHITRRGFKGCETCLSPHLYLCIFSLDYIIICGMLRGRLQKKSSVHIRDVCTLP